MFVSRKKAKGQFYHYIFMYDKNSEQGMKTVYSLGKKDKAIDQLSAWKYSTREIPIELINLGLKKERIDQWCEKIEGL